jgi:hypothetical protein
MFGSLLPTTPQPTPLPPQTHPLPPIPSLPGRNCSELFSNFVEEYIKNNKKDKAFLLVEIRIATQRDS